ncbi:MAG: ABC transporter ATP-binding protein [Burkholderiaceae bacterium]
MPALLTVNGLSKSFGALQVTENVSFEVNEGEILGIIGPNGAGKTTLFGLLAGNLAPSHGRISFAGEDISLLAPHERARRGIARTYQVPRPFTHMSVADNLRVAARFGGAMSEQEARNWTGKVMAMTGLRTEAQTLAGRLPLLLRKRHELARALAIRPRLLLIDEVAAGLTDQEVNQFIELVFTIRRIGVTIVWIEHVMKTMLTATDRLIALQSGRILAVGPAQQVINQPEVRKVYLGA